MPATSIISVGCSFAVAVVALSGCGGPGTPGPSVATPPAPQAPPVTMAGRWQLSSPTRGQCYMNLGAASPAAGEGTVAPEGGCPGKFFTSRKWSFERDSLIIRDHTGQPLAQLSAADGRFDGKATSGEPVTLTR
jgi:hypothetical protein